jgi:D-glycero-alpha-D-manno-heptose-7-phosphate kinase
MVITSSTPVRICDNGGWTDTWFGGPGRVLHVAVRPGVTVEMRATTGGDGVFIEARSFGDRYPIVPRAPREARHALLEAVVDEFPPPQGCAVEISVRSAVPPGSGTGTSAAVAVAMVGALTAARHERRSRRELAYLAHRLEVEVLGAQSGIQDHLCAAFGGINYLEIDRYPDATLHSLAPWDELSARLVVVFLGRGHDSSDIHRRVIEDAGRCAHVFARLRSAASDARDAVVSHDFSALGAAMIANTEAQESLHAELVGADARRVIETAAACGAIGWKVNGAGGDGGSVTLLTDGPGTTSSLTRKVVALDGGYRVLPVRISWSGLEVGGAL